MIYQDVDAETNGEVERINKRLDQIPALIEQKKEQAKAEDSKKKELELLEEIKQLRQEERNLWGEKSSVQTEAFKRLLKEEYGVADNPKFDKAYEIAYEHGHSSGFSEIEGFFMDIVELIR